MCCSHSDYLIEKNFNLRSSNAGEYNSRKLVSDSFVEIHAPKKTIAAPVEKANKISNKVLEILETLPRLDFGENSGKSQFFNYLAVEKIRELSKVYKAYPMLGPFKYPDGSTYFG